MKSTADITGFHAHVYFDDATKQKAETLREKLATLFTVKLGRSHDGPIGPHPKAMYEVDFAPDQFGAFVAWLMLNRDGLSILVHPKTGDIVLDHVANPLWLGEQLPLDVEVLRAHATSWASRR